MVKSKNRHAYAIALRWRGLSAATDHANMILNIHAIGLVGPGPKKSILRRLSLACIFVSTKPCF